MLDISFLSGDDSGFVKITNEAGFSATLCDVGASIYELRYGNDPLTVTPVDRRDFLKTMSYFGKTAGRIAGRVKDAVLRYDRREYLLVPNEGPTCLHGGPSGFGFKKFKMEINDVEGLTAVDFFLDSPDLDGGFPGAVHLRVRYIVDPHEAKITVSFKATSDQPTPLNLTNHAYFNLGGYPDVEGHLLRVASSETETYDPLMIPLGFEKIRPCLDFRVAKTVGQDILDPYLQNARTKGYDHCYKLDAPSLSVPSAVFESAKYRLDFYTDAPAVQIYSDNYPSLGRPLTSGRPERLHSGLTFEAVSLPDDYRSMTVLPGQIARREIIFAFAKKAAL